MGYLKKKYDDVGALIIITVFFGFSSILARMLGNYFSIDDWISRVFSQAALIMSAVCVSVFIVTVIRNRRISRLNISPLQTSRQSRVMPTLKS